VGLAFATAFTGFLNAALLYLGLRRRGIYTPTPGWTRFWLQIVFASALMAAVVWFGRGELDRWIAWSAWQRAWHLGLWIAAGMASYWAALRLVGVRWKDVTAAGAPV
jgi:putative peptidoglycan lipid II flippase